MRVCDAMISPRRYNTTRPSHTGIYYLLFDNDESRLGPSNAQILKVVTAETKRVKRRTQPSWAALSLNRDINKTLQFASQATLQAALKTRERHTEPRGAAAAAEQGVQGVSAWGLQQDKQVNYIGRFCRLPQVRRRRHCPRSCSTCWFSSRKISHKNTFMFALT